MKPLLISIRAIIILTLLTGVLYPAIITGVAQLLFPKQANGSLIQSGPTLIGSELLAQKFTSDRYFWPRPSAGDYATVPSGASNQGFLSKKLLASVNQQALLLQPVRQNLGEGGSPPFFPSSLLPTFAAPDLLYTSASGLDPHISHEAALYQIPRVATARGISPERIASLVAENTDPPQWNFLGQKRVNVLRLNLALEGKQVPDSVGVAPSMP